MYGRTFPMDAIVYSDSITFQYWHWRGLQHMKLKMRTTGASMVAIKKRIDRVNWPLAGVVYSAEPRVHV